LRTPNYFRQILAVGGKIEVTVAVKELHGVSIPVTGSMVSK
jgi:hypothetical protein